MNPLLAQIRDLLEQYLAEGEDTPVAAEASALAAAIDGAGAGDKAGGESPLDTMGGEEPMPEEMTTPGGAPKGPLPGEDLPEESDPTELTGPGPAPRGGDAFRSASDDAMAALFDPRRKKSKAR